MKTCYREVGQHLIQYKITNTMVYNNLGFSGLQRFFNMVYITDFTEKGFTVPAEFRDHFDPSRSAIAEPTKIMYSN